MLTNTILYSLSSEDLAEQRATARRNQSLGVTVGEELPERPKSDHYGSEKSVITVLCH